MAIVVEGTNNFANFIDGDSTKTLSVTSSSATGRIALGFVWAGSGIDAGSDMTYNSVTMSKLATGTDIVGGLGYRGYYLGGDSNVASGTHDFKLFASSQIIAKIFVGIISGFDTVAPIVGTPVQTDVSVTGGNPISSSGDSSWTGTNALIFGLTATANWDTLSAISPSILDFGSTTGGASCHGFVAHRAGGNVSVQLQSDHTDQYAMIGLSTYDGTVAGGGGSQRRLGGVRGASPHQGSVNYFREALMRKLFLSSLLGAKNG